MSTSSLASFFSVISGPLLKPTPRPTTLRLRIEFTCMRCGPHTSDVGFTSRQTTAICDADADSCNEALRVATALEHERLDRMNKALPPGERWTLHSGVVIERHPL